jgi:hypothetical protein
LHAWRRGFLDAAVTTVAALVKNHPQTFTSEEQTGVIIQYYLSKTKDGETMVYQWKHVDPETGKKKVVLDSLTNNCSFPF